MQILLNRLQKGILVIQFRFVSPVGLHCIYYSVQDSYPDKSLEVDPQRIYHSQGPSKDICLASTVYVHGRARVLICSVCFRTCFRKIICTQ